MASPLLRERCVVGEARRRKLLGSYPSPNDPIAAARRFWGGRSTAGPVERFRVPEGIVAVTIDVQGTAPMTCLIDAAKITEVTQHIDRASTGHNYYWVVRFVAAEFVKAKQIGDDAALQWLGLLALWTALHHPKVGAAMRRAVSDALWRDGNAHITWQFSPAIGLAMTLAKQFVDLEPIAARLPRDRVVMFAGESGKVIDCGGRR